MGKFTLSVFINRPQPDVFDFLTNPANLSKWNPVMESAEWASSGVPGIGSTYKVLAKMPGGKKEGQFEITNWDPPNRYGYKTSARVGPVESIEAVITLASKENSTQLSIESQSKLAGVPKFADGFVARMSKKENETNFGNAKRLLEAG